MNSDLLERYKLIVQIHIHAAEFRATIIRGLLLVYAALAATFGWLQSQAKPFSCLAPFLACVATFLFWMADRRHHSGDKISKEIGAAIEDAAEIPRYQRFFEKINKKTNHDLTHSQLIDWTCGTLMVALFAAAVFLIWCRGDLSGIWQTKSELSHPNAVL